MIRGKLAYLNRLYSRVPLKPIVLSQNIEGASPPSVFVGRYGYPRVDIGPLIPPQQHGDTSLLDNPEDWLAQGQDNIINFRMGLVRGKTTVNIKDVEGKMTQLMKDIALAKSSLEMEAQFSRMPQGRTFHEEHQPFGPSGPLKHVVVGNEKYEPRIEKAHSDRDMKAADAVIELYKHGIYVSKIQKAFSVGAFGLAKNRRLVPTRWSITAVDDTLGKYLNSRVKWYEPIEEFRIYETEHLDNKFVVIFTPTRWQYESMECFFPQIIGDRLEIYSDWEGYEPRKTYAAIGGCYYSAKLAINELLEQRKEQAGAIVLRECYPGYVPLGVWNVRECMRDAMKQQPKRFDSIGHAMAYVDGNMRISSQTWIRKSNLLKKTVMAGAKVSS